MHTATDGLLSLIEKDKLLQIIEIFTRATDITIDVNDAEGFPVVYHPFFYGFCQMIRSTDTGLARCIKSNADVGFKTAATGKVCFSTCHAGIVLMAVPIVVDGGFCGSITCGQMHLSPPIGDAIDQMQSATRDLGLDKHKLTQTFKEIQVISREKCLAASEMIQFIINYMIELIYRGKVKEAAALEQLRSLHQAKTRADLENSLRMAELKNLQAQIKPHFLFNTLNTIRGLITLGNNDQALQTIYALSGLLRYTVDQHDELVSLREELQYIKSYLMIQKLRFGERLSFNIDVHESLLNIQIPMLSLQPVVENACIHGLEPKENGGCLNIRGESDGQNVAIIVEDNGAGIAAGVLDQLRAKLGTVAADEREALPASTGLRNVHRRIQLYFGRHYGIQLDSASGGTKVTLKLPVLSA